MTSPANQVRGWNETTRVWDGVGAGRPALHDPSIAPNGVVYQFQNDLTDSSGNGRDLTVRAGTERYTDIYPGMRGFHFDGTTSLEFATTGTALEETGDITVGMLIYFHHIGTLVGSDSNKFVYIYEGSSEAESQNALHGIQLVGQTTGWFTERAGGINVTHAVADRPSLFEVVHLGVTRSSNVIQFYLNGKPLGAASATLNAVTGGTGSRLIIGGVFSGGTLFTEGVMSSFFIEPGTAFSASQMLAAYNSTLGPLRGVLT